MKKTILFFALTTMLLFNACSSDDNSLEQFLDITGTWNSTKFIATEPLYDANGDGINSLELLDELPCRYSKFVLNQDLTFYQENNSWIYNESSNTYECSTGNDISKVNGTWKVNSEFTLLSLTIGEHTAFLEIEFDGETLKFDSSEVFINKDAEGVLKNIYGKVIFKKDND